MAIAETTIIERVDHLVYATPDLDRGVADMEARLGVRAARGGSHPDLGTHNAVLSLGPTVYLEIIAPDPTQPPPGSPRVFGLDTLGTPRLVTWAAKAKDLDHLCNDAMRNGITLGAVRSGSRRRPDGIECSWRCTDPGTVIADGLVPFFLDWGTSPHPAQTAPRGATLLTLHAEHPHPPHVRHILNHFGLAMEVRTGPRPALIAMIDTPHGRIALG